VTTRCRTPRHDVDYADLGPDRAIRDLHALGYRVTLEEAAA